MNKITTQEQLTKLVYIAAYILAKKEYTNNYCKILLKIPEVILFDSNITTQWLDTLYKEHYHRFIAPNPSPHSAGRYDFWFPTYYRQTRLDFLEFAFPHLNLNLLPTQNKEIIQQLETQTLITQEIIIEIYYNTTL